MADPVLSGIPRERVEAAKNRWNTIFQRAVVMSCCLSNLTNQFAGQEVLVRGFGVSKPFQGKFGLIAEQDTHSGRFSVQIDGEMPLAKNTKYVYILGRIVSAGETSHVPLIKAERIEIESIPSAEGNS